MDDLRRFPAKEILSMSVFNGLWTGKGAVFANRPIFGKRGEVCEEEMYVKSFSYVAIERIQVAGLAVSTRQKRSVCENWAGAAKCRGSNGFRASAKLVESVSG